MKLLLLVITMTLFFSCDGKKNNNNTKVQPKIKTEVELIFDTIKDLSIENGTNLASEVNLFGTTVLSRTLSLIGGSSIEIDYSFLPRLNQVIFTKTEQVVDVEGVNIINLETQTFNDQYIHDVETFKNLIRYGHIGLVTPETSLDKYICLSINNNMLNQDWINEFNIDETLVLISAEIVEMLGTETVFILDHLASDYETIILNEKESLSGSCDQVFNL